MINTTSTLKLILNGSQLDCECRQSLFVATAILLGTWGHKNHSANTATRNFSLENIRAPLDAGFVNAAYAFTQLPVRNTGAGALVARLSTYLHELKVPATVVGQSKRLLKIFILDLWQRGVVLLPSVFRLGSYAPVELLDHPLMQWICSYSPNVSVDKTQNSGRRLRYYGPRLLLTASWRDPGDVKLSELMELQSANHDWMSGVEREPIVAGMIPFTLFAFELRKNFPEQVCYTESELRDFGNWVIRQGVPSNAATVRAPAARRRKPHAVNPLPVNTLDAPESLHAALLNASNQLGSAEVHDRWGTPSYPGREQVKLSEQLECWQPYFLAYFQHRKNQGFRSEKTPRAALAIVVDYLFFYLPGWKEIYPDSQIALPTAPLQFSRYAYVMRHREEPIEQFPVPLPRFVAIRRTTKGSYYGALRQIAQFFRWLEITINGEQGKQVFLSPINEEFDIPRHGGRKKTAKAVIPTNLYGFLLAYCHALEQFGEVLLKHARSGEPSLAECAGQSHIETQAFGSPVIRYRGNTHVLSTVPNIYTWQHRKLNPEIGVWEGVTPHTTTLRLLTTAVETGLRCQSIQWLDIDTWDSLNARNSDDLTYALLVNTDKTRDKPWTTFIVKRVHQLLSREKQFQWLWHDRATYGPVLYENSEVSPFAPVKPLFRSARGPRPVSDNNYHKFWHRLFFGFEKFYREVAGQPKVQLCKLEPLVDVTGQTIVRQQANGALYSPLRLVAAYTPHGCRATFATNRQDVLDVTDVANLIGHADPVTTAYYTVPSPEQLRSKLAKSDGQLTREFVLSCDSSTESAYVRADTPESSLVQGFHNDRAGTIGRFRFMPSIAQWSVDDVKLGKEALDALRDGPMSRIVFRETHICPVGEVCPAEVIKVVGAPRRCGTCPLAMKCIDHLPAIAAKKNYLRERCQFHLDRLELLRVRGEPIAVLDAVWFDIELDVNELLGWAYSHETLQAMLEDQSESLNPDQLHAHHPEMVRQHLQLVSRQCNQKEFVLRRISDSNAYPSFTSEAVRSSAAAIRRKLLARVRVPELDKFDPQDDVAAAARLLKIVMQAEGLSLADVAESLADTRIPGRVAPVLTGG